MKIINRDLVIIGGGPAGLAAAVSAWDSGIKSLLVIERDSHLGGILNQCIHNGFGLHTFKEELTGPEYADRFIKMTDERGIPYITDTIVTDVSDDKTVTAMNSKDGIFKISAKAVILAMGCRERPRGALNTPGFRGAGIYSAGTAQKLVNIDGYMPGKKVVILGSGDIGLIMARRMTLEGAEVKCVCEIMPYSGGLKRNIVQCLDDFGIPLKLSHTVVDIEGRDRVEAVTIAQVDEKLKPIPGTEERIECDTLLLSVGLLPENELTTEAGIKMSRITGGAEVNESFETSVNGIFACGNVLHVHDLVDYVSQEARAAGKAAAEYIAKGEKSADRVPVYTQNGVRYTVPQSVDLTSDCDVTVRFRVSDNFRNKKVCVYIGDELVSSRRKNILAPGEMEQVKLKSDVLKAHSSAKSITVKLEDC